jgi:hypothetical protein
MLTLTKKQKEELHKAILLYLAKHAPDAAPPFAAALDLPLPEERDEGPTAL